VAFYRGADACLIVCDVNDETPLQGTQRWIEELAVQTGDHILDGRFPLCIVGNKTDLGGLDRETAVDWCSKQGQCGLPYFETSAKDGTGVEEVFTMLAERVLHNMAEEEDEDTAVYPPLHPIPEAMPRKDWVEDTHIHECKACSVPFGLLRRKHHCRVCGNVFCDECTSKRTSLRGARGQQRVCDPCWR